jgi:hypothetical protein
MYALMRRASALISFLYVLVSAHQPVFLNEGDTTPAKGPLLKDGTVSFAVYAFVPEGETRGLRASFKKGDRLQFEILIPDKEPEKSYTNAELPTAVITLPFKKTITVKPSERTYFFEPYSGRCACQRKQAGLLNSGTSPEYCRFASVHS